MTSTTLATARMLASATWKPLRSGTPPSSSGTVRSPVARRVPRPPAEVVPQEASDSDGRDDRVDERAAPGRGTDGDGQGPEQRAEEPELETPRGEIRRADLAEFRRAGDRQEPEGEDGADDEHPDDEGSEALGQDGPPQDRMGERQARRPDSSSPAIAEPPSAAAMAMMSAGPRTPNVVDPR